MWKGKALKRSHAPRGARRGIIRPVEPACPLTIGTAVGYSRVGSAALLAAYKVYRPGTTRILATIHMYDLIPFPVRSSSIPVASDVRIVNRTLQLHTGTHDTYLHAHVHVHVQQNRYAESRRPILQIRLDQGCPGASSTVSTTRDHGGNSS